MFSSASSCAMAIAVVCLVSVSASAEAEEQRTIAQRMKDVIDPVVVDGVEARRALEWWSSTTGIPLVIDWAAMEQEGIDPATPISLDLRFVPAGQLLALMMRMLPADPTQELLFETTPWYVQVLTKNMANRQPVLRVYDIGDLLHHVPTFDNAPTMDLRESLSNTSSGGSAQSLRSIFEEQDRSVPVASLRERGEDIAQLIRDTIEPTIWKENGGEYASIRYFNRRLVVNAPLYVHAQIGIPETLSRDVGGGAAPSSRWTQVKPRGSASDIASVQPGPAKRVGGVAP